jgi:glycerol-3-phosphate acyltransferase PlsX
MDESISGNSRCRIVVDAMGGDFAPQNAVTGAVQASAENKNFDLFLTGRKDEICKVLSDNGLEFPDKNIIHAPDVIEMGESPTTAIKNKPDSSIVIGTKLVRDGKADAFVSAGNTGAVMAASTLIIGRIAGVGRPTIGAFIPNTTGVTILFDVGASVDSKPQHLVEYAVMGSIFTKEMYGIDKPTVGLLSVGEEESKGSEAVVTAHRMLKKSNLNFIGNIEGRDILKGTANVIICDGFIGNILLKFGESFVSFLKTRFKNYADKSIVNKLRVGIAKDSLKSILKEFDYQEYGGVPLLGVNGITIIGHGSSTPKAVKNMVLRANEMYCKNLIQKIESSIKNYSNLN